MKNPPSTPLPEPAKKPEMPEELKMLLRPECRLYFDTRDSSYLCPLNGRYVAMKKTDIALRMKAIGLSDKFYIVTKEMGSIPQAHFPFYDAQNARMIDYSGPIAGRRVGPFTDSVGKVYLVTDEAAGVWAPLIKNAEEPKFFAPFVRELLPDDQADHFFFSLALSLRSLRAGDFAPGQATIFAGAPKCGKSLLQHCITEIMGGRSANPFEYLMGEKFNKDLVSAEHWMVEDPGTSTDIRTRREFGEKIKEATVNRDIRINGKGKDAGLIQIFRRVTISVNKEKESLAVCPPMDEGVRDKINLYLCEMAEKVFEPFKDKAGRVNRAALWTAFLSEVHQIRSWLLNTYKKVPKSLVDERFGIVAYHHPEIMAELSSMTYESRFLELIDELYFSDDGSGPVTRKSAEFQKELLEHNRFEAEKVLRYPGQCGSHLAKLWKRDGSILTGHDDAGRPYRISRRVKDGYTFWTIKPPFTTNEAQ
jgi:hypothetical protein